MLLFFFFVFPETIFQIFGTNNTLSKGFNPATPYWSEIARRRYFEGTHLYVHPMIFPGVRKNCRQTEWKRYNLFTDSILVIQLLLHTKLMLCIKKIYSQLLSKKKTLKTPHFLSTYTFDDAYFLFSTKSSEDLTQFHLCVSLTILKSFWKS